MNKTGAAATAAENPADEFVRRAAAAVAGDSFLLLRVRPAAGFPADVRLVDLKAGRALSFITHEARADRTENFSVADGLQKIAASLAPPSTAWLETADRNWQLVVKTGRAKLVPHKPAKSKKDAAAVAQAAPPRAHDREKSSRLRGANTWLAALELTDAAGAPRPGRADKLRQIERYADLLAHFATDCGWKAGAKITVADMGCGKGYLTFAAWHVLRRELGIEATVIGVDAQPALVESCSSAAAKTGADGLSFRAGNIADADLPPPDALIALHACNDATDHALARGVAAGAKLIIVAPCCHKDVRRALGAPEPLAPLLGHGLFKERFAEWLTDGLRVLALEAAGYRVKAAEFVDAGHTPKNVLLGAIRGNTETARRDAAQKFLALKQWAGLGALAMDRLVSDHARSDGAANI